MIRPGTIVPILLACALCCGACCPGSPRNDTGRYCFIAAFDGMEQFEAKNYLETLRVHEAGIALVYARLQNSTADVLRHKGNYTIQYNPRFLSMAVCFDEGDWTRNIRINVHSAGRVGFEAVSPKFRIRDRSLGIDYFVFVGSNCPVGQKELGRIVTGTFGVEKLPNVLFNGDLPGARVRGSIAGKCCNADGAPGRSRVDSHIDRHHRVSIRNPRHGRRLVRHSVFCLTAG
jgi:hypothetical protein